MYAYMQNKPVYADIFKHQNKEYTNYNIFTWKLVNKGGYFTQMIAEYLLSPVKDITMAQLATCSSTP